MDCFVGQQDRHDLGNAGGAQLGMAALLVQDRAGVGLHEDGARRLDAQIGGVSGGYIGGSRVGDSLRRSFLRLSRQRWSKHIKRKNSRE